MMQGNFEAKKHSYRQTQDGVVVSFVIHPSDVSPEFAAAPLGTVFMVAYAEPQEEPEAPPAPAQPLRSAYSEPSDKTPGERAVIRTVLLCREPEFQRWLLRYLSANSDADWGVGISGEEREQKTADLFRRWCGIDSRRELATNARALNAFLGLEDSYLRATGRRTERR